VSEQSFGTSSSINQGLPARSGRWLGAAVALAAAGAIAVSAFLTLSAPQPVAVSPAAPMALSVSAALQDMASYLLMTPGAGPAQAATPMVPGNLRGLDADSGSR